MREDLPVNTLINGLSQEERLPLALRALYRQYGYRIYKLADFEPYDLYHENKSFLAGSNIITFTDVSGKLMTLKPDAVSYTHLDVYKRQAFATRKSAACWVRSG